MQTRILIIGLFIGFSGLLGCNSKTPGKKLQTETNSQKMTSTTIFIERNKKNQITNYKYENLCGQGKGCGVQEDGESTL